MEPPQPPTHRNASPAGAIRALVGVLVVGLLLGWLFLRGGDDGEGIGPTSTTEAETATSGPDGTDTSEGGGDPTDGTGTTVATVPVDPLQGLVLTDIGTVSQPTMITAPPGDDRLFVTERFGQVKVIQPDGTVDTFMDISDRVLANGIEQGLLGLAFHPDYETNGRFFVYFTDRPDANRQVSEFAVSTDPNVADPDSEKVLYERRQPEEATDIRHYGGMLRFGPDGYLYVSSGEGASARTQPQDPFTFFGAMLRLDVDSGDPYGIPADNPFADGVDGAPEVWAFGLRNPWRFDIDHETGLVYIGDVGQGDVEEINVAPRLPGGDNFGWANMEGSDCFFEAGCDPANYTMPAVEYRHDDGCSVTGGVVYRGQAIPELDGTYFYGDWCSGWIRSFVYLDGQVTDEQDWTDTLGAQSQLQVFGVDGDGEIIIGLMSGELRRLEPVR